MASRTKRTSAPCNACRVIRPPLKERTKLMGNATWSDDAYKDLANMRSSRVSNLGPMAAFSHTYNVTTGAVPTAVHATMDPKLVAGAKSPFVGHVMREARDSDLHPESLAIGVFFDVTGSMGSIPVALEKKLGGLMALLIQKGYVAHPQILFGAIGDANGDEVPLQVGQFESGTEMDDDLDHIYLEGHGGGHTRETYELAHYFFWKHTAIDCWEKRGQKGFFFTIGDESPYEYVRKTHVLDLIGDTLEADIPTADVIRGLEERYNVFHLICEQGSYPHNKAIEQSWTNLLGERVLKLEDKDLVAEMIAATIGLTLGTTDIDKVPHDLAVIGGDAHGARSVTTALAAYAKSGAMARAGTVSGDLPTLSGGGTATRL